MRLSQQLILFMLAAAVLPLSGVGFWLLQRSEAELSVRLEHEQRGVAEAAAEGAAAQLMGAINGISSSAGLIDWRSVSAEEARGGLQLLAAQSELIAAVALVDPRRAEAPDPVPGGEGHPAFDGARDGPRLAKALPFDSLGVHGDRGQIAVGSALELGGFPALPIAVQVSEPGKDAAFVVAFVGLQGLSVRLAARASPTAGELQLVDPENRVVASSSKAAALEPLAPARQEVVAKGQGSGRTSAGERVAVATVPERLGLTAVVSLPEAVALAPVRELRKTVLLGIGITLVFLVSVGLFFTRRLNRRLHQVSGAAEAYARGELSTRLQVGGQDELSELADTFNRMGAELEAARGRLLKWNDELKLKVDEATADLRAAQGQLVEAQKLAAIGQLGAGVAHEINNPLCGILGNAQLMMLDRAETDDDFDLLKKIEESAKRCRDITQNLLRFSQSSARADRRQLDLNAVVRSSLSFEQPRFEETKVTVRSQLSEAPMQVWADPELISQVISQLASNARTAMLKTEAKQLEVITRVQGEEVWLEVIDTGKGIPPANLERVFEPFFTTKDVWSNIGLGLSVAYRIVTEHDGRIEVESAVGKGSRFTVRLPRYDPKKHHLTTAVTTKEFSAGGQGVGITR
ncbi:MAG: Sensor histidine kinase [Myxococcaceae bacterium]|nr:Sensor histidine kinase [Myxococcaceae bacterium]